MNKVEYRTTSNARINDKKINMTNNTDPTILEEMKDRILHNNEMELKLLMTNLSIVVIVIVLIQTPSSANLKLAEQILCLVLDV